MPPSPAWACAAASETPRIALAPSRDLLGLPSSSISVLSSCCWSEASIPVTPRARPALPLPALASIAQLGCLELAGRGARRDGGVPVGAGAQPHLHLHGR